MEKLVKCWRGDDCVTCKDLTEEELQRLKAAFARERRCSLFEYEQLELVPQEKYGHRR